MLRLLSRLAILVSLCVVFFLTPASASARLVLYKVLSRQLLLKLLSLFVFISLILLIKTHTAYAETSSSFRFQNYVQSYNMVNPADILNTSGAGASTNCLSALCWNIRVSNPDVSGIPENATITGARFTLLGTGSGGNLKVTVGRNSTYCRYPATVGDRSTTLKESNDFLTSGLIPFYICDSQDGYPISVDELPNFFLEITAPKNAPFLPFSFINPFIAFDYILPVTPTPTPTITQTPTPTPDPIQVGPKIVSYKITDGFTVDPPGPLGVGRVFFNNSISVPYQRGKILLSSTPDGTGSARIGDFVQVYATYPGSGQFAYRAKPDCFTGSSILPPTDITNLFFKTTTSMGNNNITVRFSKWCAGEKVISPIYIVHIDDSGNPAPFLDLPWKYQEKGLSFDIAATAMTSYFDHEYPFLSTSLVEPPEASGNIIDFRGPPRSGRSYSLHDGYDWGRVAQAKNNEPVVAAATGSAQYVNTCGACGNAIHIDHGNGFQTRYYHLQKGGLITDVPGVSVPVEQGHQIGKVGFTGNVFPAGENGAHIHFMLVYDKNADGNFEDNIPDGLIDPFGWQSKDPDPWENYTFSYGGVDRTGMKSHYLWTTPLAGVTTAVPSNGKNTPVGSYEVITTASTNNNTEFELKAFLTPIIPPSIDLGVLGPGIVIDAFDILGNVITTFAGTYTLTVDFAEIDLSRYDPDTISLYSSSDGDNWIKEELTSIDLANKTATAELNHLTHFALMANRIDTTAPVTNVIFDGLMLSEDVFGNSVTVSLEASDGAGLGVDYIAYRFEGEDWQAYTEPISVASEGAHTIDFYAADKDENIEEVKSKVFTIEKDTTPPETSVNLIGELVGIDVYRSDVTIDFTASDGAGFGVDRTLYSMDGGEWQEVSSSILVSTDGEHTLKYYSVDRGGNAEEQQSTQFTIQHVYDTIPPEITIKFDTASKKFVYTATDSSGSASLVVNSLSQKTDEVIATDESDNELIVTLEKLRNPILSLNIVATNIETLQYGDEAVIRPGRNNLGVLYSTDRQGELKLLTQVLTSESFGNVVLHYDFGKDTTTIVETINKKIVTKKIGGMKLLQLSTNAGRLEYRY